MNPIRLIAPKTDHQLYWAFGLALVAIFLAGANSLIAGVVLMVLALAFFMTWRSNDDRARHDDGVTA